MIPVIIPKDIYDRLKPKTKEDIEKAIEDSGAFHDTSHLMHYTSPIPTTWYSRITLSIDSMRKLGPIISDFIKHEDTLKQLEEYKKDSQELSQLKYSLKNIKLAAFDEDKPKNDKGV